MFRNTIAEVNYIGTKGTHLLMRRNIAQALPYDPANPLSVSARKPFPNFVVYIDSDFSGNSNYHSMNAKLERHTSSLVATRRLHVGEEHRQQVGGGRHRRIRVQWLAGSAGQQPAGAGSRPVGLRRRPPPRRQLRLQPAVRKGEKIAGDATGVKNAIVGGWQVNGIVTFQRGFPITITAADAGGLNDSFGTNRADIVGDPYPSGFEKTVNAWFNTAAFAQPAPGRFGSIGRNTLRGPGINNMDLALFKNFEIGKGSRLQFRFESFNTFNHTQFNAPVVNVADPSSDASSAPGPAGSTSWD